LPVIGRSFLPYFLVVLCLSFLMITLCFRLSFMC
jgi:hypothetical protein